jgi:hypothetical protein
MIRRPRWRRQVGCQDERAEFCLGTADPPGLCRQTAPAGARDLAPAVGGMALDVVPDWFPGDGCRGVGGARFDGPPGVSLLDACQGWPPVDRTPSPQEAARASQMAQPYSQEVGHVDGLEDVRLATEVEAPGLALRRHGEGRPRREAVVWGAVGEARRLSRGCPGPAADRHEPKAAFIQAGHVRPQTVGCL